jgi:alkylation response protein AidB-like acyl-CoA dehydrogenase
MWISNAPFADIAVVWAKDEEGKITRIGSRTRNGRI